MLVLSRKKEESIVIRSRTDQGKSVKITVVEIGSAMVRLGFEADQDFVIHRQEVWERIRGHDQSGPQQPAPFNEGLDRWADDGGDPARDRVCGGLGAGARPVAAASAPISSGEGRGA